MRRTLALILAVMAAAGAAAARDLGPQDPGRFDYYVLALTWVPGFCAHQASSAECSKGLGFALHGLWPQDQGGDWPSNCSPVRLTRVQQDQFSTVYPDPSMIRHEWPKHGTCSGLSPADYYALSTADEALVQIPADLRSPKSLPSRQADAVRQDFLTANPGLPPNGIKVATDRGGVSEVEVCFNKDKSFRACD